MDKNSPRYRRRVSERESVSGSGCYDISSYKTSGNKGIMRLKLSIGVMKVHDKGHREK